MGRITNIRFLIPAITIIIMIVSLVAAFQASHLSARKQTEQELQKRLTERLHYLQGVTEQFLQLGLADNLQRLISGMTAESDLRSLLIVGADGTIVASSRYADIGSNWRSLNRSLSEEDIQATKFSRGVIQHKDDEKGYMEGYSSICQQSQDAELRPSLCGFINYRIDLAYHHKLSEIALQQQSIYFVIGMCILSFTILLLLHLLVTRRADRIVATLRRFNDGDRSQRIATNGRNELTWISETINQVLAAIQRGEVALKNKEQQLSALFDTVIDAIITINDRGIIQSVNPATERLFGYERNELIGQNVKILMPSPFRDEHDQYLDNYLTTAVPKVIGTGREVPALTKDGREFPAELSVSVMRIHGRMMFTGLIRDISERVKLRETMQQINHELFTANLSLKQRASTDGLTGLANRRHFDETLQSEIRRCTRQGETLSLLLLDVDYFKKYNDHYGHSRGDEALKAVSQVLQDSFKRSGDLPARYGGEEFAVILPHTSKQESLQLAEKLRETLWSRQIAHEKSDTADRLTVSIGAAVYVPKSNPPIKPEHLINTADEALYDAKQSGRNRVCQREVKVVDIGQSGSRQKQD